MKMIGSNVDYLWTEYKETGSKEAWELLVLHYRPLVVGIARHMVQPMPSNIEEEDLVSYGTFGLLDAIEKFEPSLGWQFSTYARTRIKGSIIDGMRKIDWIPRSATVRPSLVYVDGLEDKDLVLLGGSLATFEDSETKVMLHNLIMTLPWRERTVLLLYYYEDLTLKEVGSFFGLTEAWACLAHEKAVRLLRLEFRHTLQL